MSSPTSDPALDAMLSSLNKYLLLLTPLPPGSSSDPPLPASTVSLVSATERSVGLGNRRGTETGGSFPIYALKGMRLDAMIRFQLWARTPGDVDAIAAELQGRLRAAADELRETGFLQFAGDAAPLSEDISSIKVWRRTIDYRVLYEFQYKDTDGAESLISQIPIAINEELDEKMLLTDDMSRWDQVSASDLEVRGDRRRRFTVRELLILAFLPGTWDGDGVTIESSAGGAAQQRHFASVRALLNSPIVRVENEAIVLGGHPYRVGHLVFPNSLFPAPISLRELSDFFRVRYDASNFEPDTSELQNEPTYMAVLNEIIGLPVGTRVGLVGAEKLKQDLINRNVTNVQFLTAGIDREQELKQLFTDANRIYGSQIVIEHLSEERQTDARVHAYITKLDAAVYLRALR